MMQFPQSYGSVPSFGGNSALAIANPGGAYASAMSPFGSATASATGSPYGGSFSSAFAGVPGAAPTFALPGYPAQQQNTPDVNNQINVIINIINQLSQQQQQVPQPQPQNNNMMFLLLILLLQGRQEREPERRRVEREDAPAPRPRAKVETVDTGNTTTEIKELPKSPLVADLNGDGVQTSDRVINFDIDGDGQADKINDISDGDGVFTIRGGKDGKDLLGQFTDLDGDGKSDGFKDGFDALKALAEKAKKEGLIDGDNYLDENEIATLEQRYGLGIKQGSFGNGSTSLGKAGLKGINLATGQKEWYDNFDGRGNSTLKQGGATFVRNDGSTGNYEDVFFLKQA